MFYEESGGVVTPLDGDPRYSLLFRARLSGDGEASLRFDVYDFDDTKDLTNVVAQAPIRIVGAGVSTCVPLAM